MCVCVYVYVGALYAALAANNSITVGADSVCTCKHLCVLAPPVCCLCQPTVLPDTRSRCKMVNATGHFSLPPSNAALRNHPFAKTRCVAASYGNGWQW